MSVSLLILKGLQKPSVKGETCNFCTVSVTKCCKKKICKNNVSLIPLPLVGYTNNHTPKCTPLVEFMLLCWAG